MKKYTVLLLLPESLAAEGPEKTFLARVAADCPMFAEAKARDSAVYRFNGYTPSDFRTIFILDGWQSDVVTPQIFEAEPEPSVVADKRYDVHLYVSVRVKVSDVSAQSQTQAISAATDMVDLGALFRADNMRCLHGANDSSHAEDPINLALVDEVGDEGFENSQWHSVWAENLPGATGTLATSIDRVEVYPVREILDLGSGCVYAKPVITPNAGQHLDNERLVREYWGVFGHLRAGGLAPLCDCEDEASARLISAALKEVL